jgi:hypothetical protein
MAKSQPSAGPEPTKVAGTKRSPEAQAGALAACSPETSFLCGKERTVVELFISHKTASVHVSNILAKLGVANRAEAAVAAHHLGLTQGG